MAKKLDLQNLKGPQKAAIFLLVMGEEYSSQAFKLMNDSEIKRVAAAMSEIEQIPPLVLNSVMEEFMANYGKENELLIGGENFVKNVIDTTMDKNKAKSIYREIEERRRELPFVWSRDVDIHALSSHIRQEHPQTIAMILAHLPSEIAAEILSSISDEQKADIAVRIVQLGQVPEEIVREVDEALRTRVVKMGGAGHEAGGIQTLVDILNNSGKATEEVIMQSLEEDHSELANEIKSLMFTFEDLVKVDDKAMREILKKVESTVLVRAIKTASETLKQKIFGNLSTRAAEMLKEELEILGPVRLAEVEEAQQEVLKGAKELESEGKIKLGGKGKEDVLV
ncbi:MAG: flagellar motor switch protein FliG [Desulfobacterales bacterium]|nr:flagellar motor switch protein FliG [Desulfobacterales bacterium]MBF0397498.1 flagellar motor switch protein FliG [Desulfobacterales bacterium]